MVSQRLICRSSASLLQRLVTMNKKCSCDPIGPICEMTPLVDPAPVIKQTLKKSCSCEPAGPLCYLDPLVNYDWDKRPKKENCELTETEAFLEWKVIGFTA